MCTYEFAEVDLYWGRCPPAAAVPDALTWKPISDEAGQNMLQLKRAKVYARLTVCVRMQSTQTGQRHTFLAA
jgi:hypothetical protein